MTLIVVDDEPIILEGELNTARKCLPTSSVRGFVSPDQALRFAEENPIDLAILDIEMPGMNGIALARRIKALQPRCNIIFVTAYQSFALNALELHASGYILKPMRAEQLEDELQNLRYPLRSDDETLFVRCFGDFEVFSHGKPLMFTYLKTKELFAYLIDRRGALVSINDCKALLWPDSEEDHTNYFKQLRRDLFETMKQIGCGDIFARQRGGIGVLTEKIACDYYEWLKGTRDGVNAYRGEYMSQYSWAEVTHAGLERDQ